MKPIIRTEKDVYETFMEHVARGEVPGCIQVEYNDSQAVWTSSGTVPSSAILSPQDGLAIAIIAIRRARSEAIKAGLHPVN